MYVYSESKQGGDGGGHKIEPEAVNAIQKQKRIEGTSLGCLVLQAFQRDMEIVIRALESVLNSRPDEGVVIVYIIWVLQYFNFVGAAIMVLFNAFFFIRRAPQCPQID